MRSVVASEYAPTSYDEWPATIPAVAQLLRDGLELVPGVTLLVGENGSGKSTAAVTCHPVARLISTLGDDARSQ